jgi:putative ABC transport system permease protein
VITGILTEGLIYGLMTLGVFITFRVLSFADMTCDGSFPLGAAVAGVLLAHGHSAAVALPAAALAGAGAGLVTALIHTRLRIPDLLSGILTMTMLRSVNLRVMENRANISLLKTDTVFTRLNAASRELAENLRGGSPSLGDSGIIENIAAFVDAGAGALLYCLLAVVVIKFILDLFFRTDFGISLGALGCNPQLIIAQGMNPDMLKIAGISLANGLIAVSGALAAMYQGFADINFGQGMIVSGLAALMMGEFLIRSNRFPVLTLRVILGSILYRALMYLARNYGYHIGMTPNDLNLITGLLIITCIIFSNLGFRSGYGKRWNLLTGKKRKAREGPAAAQADRTNNNDNNNDKAKDAEA